MARRMSRCTRMNDFDRLIDRWRLVVNHTTVELSEVDDAAARRRPAPGKWSIKEIIGHLIDAGSPPQAGLSRRRAKTI